MFPNHKSGRYSVTADGTLHIRNVQYEDGGQYVCHGLNVLGSEETAASLTVIGQWIHIYIIYGEQNIV